MYETAYEQGWVRGTCSHCGIAVAEQFDQEQVVRFTTRLFFGTGPLTRDARDGREAVHARIVRFFREKGCPHV
jgi:hypothetical protein